MHRVGIARDVPQTRGTRERRAPKRALLLAGGVFIVLGLALLFGFGPLVRSKIAKESARRHLDVTVGKVRPGWFAVKLGDVRIHLEGVDGVDVKLDEVKVSLSAGFAVTDLAAKGGEIRLDGEPDVLAQRLRDFRKKDGEATEKASVTKTPISVDDLAIAWKMGGGDVTGSGVHLSRSDGIHATCTHLSAKVRDFGVEVEGGDLELGADNVVKRVGATALTIAQESKKDVTLAVPTKANSSTELAPPPLPSAAPKKGVKPVALKKVEEPVSTEPIVPFPDLHALRSKIGTFAAAFGPRIPDGSKVDIGGLTAKLDVGGEAVAFGPGPFSLERHADLVKIAFSSETKVAKGTPLAMELDLPLGEGDVSAHLSGGPVSLALLGVKEGTKGLFDVQKGMVSGKGQLVLSAKGDALTFDGEIGLKSISMKQPRLSGQPLVDLDFSVAARGMLDDQGRLRVDDASIDMGALHVKTHGNLEETTDHFGVSLNLEVAPAACQALLESTPKGLLPLVRGSRMSGTFGGTARVAFDTRTIDKMTLEYQVDDRCRVTEVPREMSRERFASVFSYRTYHPDGTQGDTSTGPGSSAWTDLDDISPYMVAAVLTTEDGAFYKHHGFNHSAIKNSVAANLKARRFVRGASTITMQLSKNLFLSRDKTLSRKIEEVILTDYLEQAFRKDDMMELYLNVIEFGPDVYGITRAADYYFGRKPEELTVPECFFLASLLPSPIRYGRMRDKGELTEGWARHLNSLMEIAARNKKISASELAEAESQKVTFRKAGDPRPEPREAVARHRRDPTTDDAAWSPVD